MRQPNRYWLMQIITVSTAYRGESGQAIDQSTNSTLHWDNHPETYMLCVGLEQWLLCLGCDEH